VELHVQLLKNAGRRDQFACWVTHKETIGWRASLECRHRRRTARLAPIHHQREQLIEDVVIEPTTAGRLVRAPVQRALDLEEGPGTNGCANSKIR
jgi:hypothetical protein